MTGTEACNRGLPPAPLIRTAEARSGGRNGTANGCAAMPNIGPLRGRRGAGMLEG